MSVRPVGQPFCAWLACMPVTLFVDTTSRQPCFATKPSLFGGTAWKGVVKGCVKGDHHHAPHSSPVEGFIVRSTSLRLPCQP